MINFIVTTTDQHSEAVQREILRLDGAALITYRQKAPSTLLVRSGKLSRLTFETIPGVAQAYIITQPNQVRAFAI